MELSRFKTFSKFQINNFLTDIEIILINGTIKAHKLVLAASSEFFKVLLNNDGYKEVSTGIIKLPSVDFDVFNYIFDHIYLRNTEINLHKDLSFYIDVIQASDYLQMLDIIDLVDHKISTDFSFLELIKDFERIFLLPMKKTKIQIIDNVTAMINSSNYSELTILSPSILSKIFSMDNFTINENALWNFLRIYFEKHNENASKQEIIDFIRPGLLNNSNLESFFSVLTKYNVLWRDHSEKDLKIVLANLPDEKIREMNFIGKDEFVSKVRSIPYLMVIGSGGGGGVTRTLQISKISLLHFQYENSLNFDVSPDNFRCHSFENHFVLISEYWDFNTNFGIIFDLANFNDYVIPCWQLRNRELDDFSRIWGFSCALVDAELYIFGGCYFTHLQITVPSTVILKFNFLDNKWTTCQGIKLKIPCWSSSTVKDNRNNRIVYLSGGRSPQKYLKNFYAIDLETCSISDFPNLPFTITGHTMQMVGNTIFVFGGTWDNCVRNEILLFDLSNSLWRIVTVLDIPESRHVDYCFQSTDKFVSDQIVFYDLRLDSAGKTRIYSHQIDIANSENVGNHSLIDTDFKCAFPNKIIFGMSTKSPNQTSMEIKQSILGFFPGVDNDQNNLF